MSGGGGGGRSYGGGDPKRVRELVERTRQENEAKRLEGDVNRVLQDLLSDYNQRDIELIKSVLSKVSEALGDRLEACLFGGSVAKHTYVDGISDVDALVLLPDSRATPKEQLERLHRELKERLPYKNITIGRMAVTVTVKGTEIQLVPCVKKGDHYKISSSNPEKWAKVDPMAFRSKLSSRNSELNNSLVPSIKIIKSMNSKLPKELQLRGYHIEALAVAASEGYIGPKTVKQVVLNTLERGSKMVLGNLKDLTGQSRTVDQYLGDNNSIPRRAVSEKLRDLHSKLSSATTADQWRDIIG